MPTGRTGTGVCVPWYLTNSAQCVRIDNDTSPVPERLRLQKKDKPSETQTSLSSNVHTSKVKKKTSFRLGPSSFRKVARPPFNLLIYTKNQEAHIEMKEALMPKKAQHVQKLSCSIRLRSLSIHHKAGSCPVSRSSSTARSTRLG